MAEGKQTRKVPTWYGDYYLSGMIVEGDSDVESHYHEV